MSKRYRSSGCFSASMCGMCHCTWQPDPEAKASHGLTTLCESASLVTVHTQVLCSGPSAARSGWNRSKEKKYLSCTGISVCLKSNWTFTCLYSFYWSVVLSYISAVVLQGSLSLILKNIPLFHRLRYKIAFTKYCVCFVVCLQSFWNLSWIAKY